MSFSDAIFNDGTNKNIILKTSETLAFLRLPLFTIISGWLYGIRPVKNLTHFKKFWLGKTRRIIIPTIIALIIYYILRPNYVANPAFGWRDFLDYLYIPSTHLWFINLILTIFLIVSVLDLFQITKNIWFLIVTILTSFTIYYLNLHEHVTVQLTEIFALNRLLEFLPFFLFGIILSQLPRQHKFKLYWIIISLLVVAVQLLTASGLAFESIQTDEKIRSILMITSGISGSYLLFQLRPTNRLFAYLGKFSLGIYIYHIIGYIVAFELMQLCFEQVKPTTITMLILTVSGLAFPHFLEKLFSLNSFLNTLLFGNKRNG